MFPRKITWLINEWSSLLRKGHRAHRVVLGSQSCLAKTAFNCHSYKHWKLQFLWKLMFNDKRGTWKSRSGGNKYSTKASFPPSGFSFCSREIHWRQVTWPPPHTLGFFCFQILQSLVDWGIPTSIPSVGHSTMVSVWTISWISWVWVCYPRLLILSNISVTHGCLHTRTAHRLPGPELVLCKPLQSLEGK